MKNATMTLDEEVARWARVRAAELDTSLSRLIGQMLREHMLADKDYDTACRRYLSRRATAISTGKYPRRDDLHDR